MSAIARLRQHRWRLELSRKRVWSSTVLLAFMFAAIHPVTEIEATRVALDSRPRNAYNL
jgi:hypothetical protein